MGATGKARSVIEAMRCHHWVKNLFVVAAPLFARQLTVPDKLAATCAAFVAFCLASSAIYVLNDVVDIEYDRVHPLKRNRPIASGRLSVAAAIRLAVILGAIALVLGYRLIPAGAAHVVAVYIVLNILYSLVLKHHVILDVMILAAGFLLRILAGALATSVEPSFWLLLCTLNVSLFLGFTKRRAEITTSVPQEFTNQRKVLEDYSPAFLDQMISIVTGATLVCYILYTVDNRTHQTYGTYGLALTIPFVMYGLFRYLYLSYHKRQGESPTRTILTDVPFLVNIALWTLICTGVIYWGHGLPW